MGLFRIPVQHGNDNICVLRAGRPSSPLLGTPPRLSLEARSRGAWKCRLCLLRGRPASRFVWRHRRGVSVGTEGAPAPELVSGEEGLSLQPTERLV